MATKREKVLMTILAGLVVLAGTIILLTLYSDRVKQLDTQIKTYTSQIVKIREKLMNTGSGDDPRAELSERISEAEHRFYKPGETDTYKFGLEIQALFSAYGIKVESYRNTADKNAKYLEYNLKGNALSWMRFLKRLSEYEKAVRVHALSLKGSGDGELGGVLRVGYEEIDNTGN